MEHVSIHISDGSCGFYLILWKAKQIRQTYTPLHLLALGNYYGKHVLRDFPSRCEGHNNSIHVGMLTCGLKTSFRTQVLARIEILNACNTQMHSKTMAIFPWFSHVSKPVDWGSRTSRYLATSDQAIASPPGQVCLAKPKQFFNVESKQLEPRNPQNPKDYLVNVWVDKRDFTMQVGPNRWNGGWGDFERQAETRCHPRPVGLIKI